MQKLCNFITPQALIQQQYWTLFYCLTIGQFLVQVPSEVRHMYRRGASKIAQQLSYIIKVLIIENVCTSSWTFTSTLCMHLQNHSLQSKKISIAFECIFSKLNFFQILTHCAPLSYVLDILCFFRQMILMQKNLCKLCDKMKQFVWSGL